MARVERQEEVLENETIGVRTMKEEDLASIVEIDSMISGTRRVEYYRKKIHAAVNEKGINTSLVAEKDGRIVGFIMGELYYGEFGIPETLATIDTIGVHPHHQRKRVATALIEQFISIARAVRVDTIHTLVNWNDWDLLRFFEDKGFVPAGRINLELKL